MDLLILVKENLKSKKGTFIGLGILMMIISFILITIISINKNIDESIDKSHKYIDAGDVFTWINPDEKFDSIIKKLSKLDNVKKINVNDVVEITLDINNENYTKNTLIRAYSNSKNRIYNSSNTGFIKKADLKKGEMYLPINFKTNYNVKLNQIVHIVVENASFDFKVKGFIEEPISGSSMMGIKSIFVSDKDLDFMKTKYNSDCIKNNCTYNMKFVQIYNKNKSDDEDFSRYINKKTSIIDKASFSLTKSESKYYHTTFNKIISRFLYVFAAILTLVVVIVISYSINNSIEMEFVSIGILKSIGINTLKIRASLIIEYLIVCLLGSIIGGILSLVGIKYLSSLLVSITGILPVFSINKLSLYLLFILILFIMIFIIIKTAKVSKISPIQAITNESMKINKNLIKNKITSHLLNLKLAIRQLFSNIYKYISIIFISFILVLVMSIITSLNSELQSGKILETLGFIPYDIYVNKSDQNYDEVDKIIEKYTTIKNKFNFSGWYFTLEDYQYYGQVTSSYKSINNITKGRKPKNNKEILITSIIAEKINKHIGDTVTVGFKGNKQQFKIVGYYQTTNDVGKCFMISSEAMKQLYPEIKFSSYVYKLKDPTKGIKIEKELKSKYGNKIEAEDVSSDSDFTMIKKVFRLLNLITFSTSIVFILISIVLISHRVLINEEKNFGIYKAIGFNANRLRLQFSLRFLFVSIIGTIIGTIAYMLLNSKILVLLLKSMGITSYKSSISINGILLPTIIVNICFFGFTFLLSRKIKKISTKNLITE